MNSEIIARLESSFAVRIDLKTVSTGDLVKALLDRNEPGRVCIEITAAKE